MQQDANPADPVHLRLHAQKAVGHRAQAGEHAVDRGDAAVHGLERLGDGAIRSGNAVGGEIGVESGRGFVDSLGERCRHFVEGTEVATEGQKLGLGGCSMAAEGVGAVVQLFGVTAKCSPVFPR